MLRIIKSKFLVRFTASQNLRHHSYQKAIYTSNFSANDATLTRQLTDLNRYKTEQPNLYRYVKAYHQHGHKAAAINPLNTNTVEVDELRPDAYVLSHEVDYATEGILFSNSNGSMKLNEIETYLKRCYSSQMSIEFEHLSTEEEKLWLNREFEQLQSSQLDDSVRIELAKLLLKSQVNSCHAFDYFN